MIALHSGRLLPPRGGASWWRRRQGCSAVSAALDIAQGPLAPDACVIDVSNRHRFVKRRPADGARQRSCFARHEVRVERHELHVRDLRGSATQRNCLVTSMIRNHCDGRVTTENINVTTSRKSVMN
jgi:hypothetical protein